MRLGYGRGEVRLDLSNRTDVRVFLPVRAETAGPPADLLAGSLDNPVGSAPLRELAAGKRSVAIAVPDKTRPPVARDLLPPLLDILAAAGVPQSGVRIFISCGVHSKHTDGEVRQLVGDGIFEGLAVCQNEGDRLEDFVHLGKTSRGTPVEVNRVIADADLAVLVGGLAFHYFAGFSGGRKMIIPGAASIDTVRSNHRLTLRETGGINPACRSGRLDGNPVHEDMMEAVRHLTSETYLINVLRDGWGNTADIISGDLNESHRQGTRVVTELFKCPIDEPCDVAITSAGGYPLDVNMIQSHKSLEHAAAAVRDGGVLIGVLACEDGIGSDTFLPWFRYGDSAQVARNLYRNYQLNGHTALSFIKKRERLNIILVTTLPPETVKAMGVTGAENVDAALRRAETIVGENARVYVFPRAWGLLPEVKA
jgi:nickel-dependent lactate racemase